MMLKNGIYSYWKFVAGEHRKTLSPSYRAKRQGKAILVIVKQGYQKSKREDKEIVR